MERKQRRRSRFRILRGPNPSLICPVFTGSNKPDWSPFEPWDHLAKARASGNCVVLDLAQGRAAVSIDDPRSGQGIEHSHDWAERWLVMSGASTVFDGFSSSDQEFMQTHGEQSATFVVALMSLLGSNLVRPGNHALHNARYLKRNDEPSVDRDRELLSHSKRLGNLLCSPSSKDIVPVLYNDGCGLRTDYDSIVRFPAICPRRLVWLLDGKIKIRMRSTNAYINEFYVKGLLERMAGISNDGNRWIMKQHEKIRELAAQHRA